MRAELSPASARAAVGAAVVFRLFYGLMIEGTDIHNGAWLSVLIGLLLALPALWLIHRVDGRRAAMLRWALGLALMLDAADALKCAAFSESCLAFNHVPAILLALPLLLAAARCMALGGDAIGASARIGIMAAIPLLAVIVFCQRPYYRPGWLFPIWGYGMRTILRYGLRCAAWIAIPGGAGLVLCDDKKSFPGFVRTLCLACGATVVLIVLRLMMAPFPAFSEMSRRAMVDALLTNGRAPLVLQLPMIVIWFIGMLNLLCFEAWAAMALVPFGIKKAAPLVTLLMVALLSLSGCRSSGEVENQAYALVLGIDEAGRGGIELTIRIPRIGHAGGQREGGEGSDEPYLVLAAAGDSYAQALEQLQWATARELNLSHLKLIVASEALAKTAAFPNLITEIAETRHLYTTAGFVVCQGRARAFIEGQETILGAHLSDEITAMFKHYSAHGYIPRATFAELYYATQSCYADPAGIWGFMDAGEQESQPAASVITDDTDRLNADTLTASSRQYLGAALFREGRMVGQIGAKDTLLLNLLTGRVDAFTYACGGETCMLSTLRGPNRRVTISGGRVRLSAGVYLTAEDSSGRAMLDRAERQMEAELTSLIQRCQSLRVDPFGFAERAARYFPTYDQWMDFDWRAGFAGAEIDVSVAIAGSELVNR